RPVCAGRTSSHAFLVLEFLPLGASSSTSQEELGRHLAALHRVSSPSFGWDHDNFIGTTPQPNRKTERWTEFLRDHRLGHMIHLARERGFKLRRTT
ncbi:MAG: fructosamine kinase family protein, partial [Akkermansiaceae bacterium]|nr:fructosamine kinase family protein [Akkermansiaceae bacterium]